MKCKRRSVLYVVEKAARRLPTKSGALRRVIAMTTVEADFPTRDSSVVSHLGCLARANPELKVVGSDAIASIEYEVGIPCTKRYITGVSNWTLTVPGMRWKKVPTWLLSRVAFVDSIVVRVTESLHSNHLYIGFCQSCVYLVSEFQRRHVEWRAFFFDNHSAFSRGRSLPLGGSGNRRWSSRPGSVVGLFAFLDYHSPQGGGGRRGQACSKWGVWVRSDIQWFCFGNLKRYRCGCFRTGVSGLSKQLSPP